MDLEMLSTIVHSLWTVWLTVAFVAIATWAYWPKNKARFEQDAYMVFDDEKNGGCNHG